MDIITARLIFVFYGPVPLKSEQMFLVPGCSKASRNLYSTKLSQSKKSVSPSEICKIPIQFQKLEMEPVHDDEFDVDDEAVFDGSSHTALHIAQSAFLRAHRALQVDAQGNPLEENPESRVFDIGWGTFILLLVAIIYLGICCYGSMVKNPHYLYCWSTFFASVIVTFLFTAQRTSRWKSDEETVDDTDPYFNARLFLMIFFIWVSCWTCCAITYLHLTADVKPGETESMSEMSTFVSSRAVF